MLSRSEVRHFRGSDMAEVALGMQQALAAHGLAFYPVAPGAWTAKGPIVYGLLPKVDVIAYPAAGGFTIELRVNPEFDTNGIVIFVVLWMFCFPGAIVGAILAYQDFTNRQNALLYAAWAPFWQRLAAAAGAA